MKKLVFLLVFSCIICTFAFAAENDRIAKIDVIGNERIDKGVVTNAIKTREGDVYDPTKTGEDLKSIYRTGFFSDVMVDVKDSEKGKIITFVVVERPPVSAIYIAGNKKVKTEDIRDKLKIKSGTVLNTEKVKESVDEIRKLYASKGYYAAKVNYEINQEEGYRAELRFIVEEPQRAYVRKITFTGNRSLKAGKIKGALRTREKGVFSWFTGSGILDEEALDEDRKQIEALYHDNGHVRVKVAAPDIKISPDGKSISIAFKIDEGNVYKIGDVDFKGDIAFDQTEIRKKLKNKTGNTFRSSLFQEDVLMLTDIYQDMGYAFVDIAPLTGINDETKTVDISFDIAKGSEVFFNRINIVGNTKTRDKVVRRELKFAEGDRYSSSKMKESKRRLTNTTYFKNLDLKTIKTDEPDKVNLDVLVEEKPTGTLSLGVGYSTYEKILLTGSVSQENIFGTGKKVYLDASLSSIARLYNITLVDPYIFDKNLSTSLNVFNTIRYFDTYTYGGTGGSFTVSRPITDYLRAALRYRFERISVTDITDDAGSFIQEQAGTKSTSSVTASLTRNTIDDILNPSIGVIASASLEVAGGPFMADNNFIKGILSYGRYFPLKWGTALFLRGTAGTVRQYGGTTVPVYERFYVGGISTVRGFRYGEAGPTDPATDDVIGAQNELIFNSELIFPIYKPAGLKGVVFFDYGKGFDEMNGFFQSLRPAAGFGVRWFSPMGPIRLELGFNLNRKSGERGTVFDFSMGKPF
ncbi:MAG: Outer membrane protein assembly factor BamA precursor [Syntrophorhabdaceae bacterium PtaU1.Bin034]|nr:MAG: Outer membrane protein assembly factor BamA precursor [Syntrophorhabdaceae bacterium PtaU1.Bin034]